MLLALPAVVWAFLASLWFGLSSTGPILAVILTAIPFMAVNLSAGVRNIDPGLVKMSRSFGVPAGRRLYHLLLGGTLPSGFTGLRLAFMTGWNSLLIVNGSVRPPGSAGVPGSGTTRCATPVSWRGSSCL